MKSVYKTESALILKNSKESFLTTVFTLIFPFLFFSDNRIIILLFVIALFGLMMSLYIFNNSFITVSLYTDKLTITIGLNRKERIVKYTDIERIEIYPEWESPKGTLLRKRSKGQIGLIYRGKNKFEKVTNYLDLNTFNNAENLKEELLVLSEKLNNKKVVANKRL